MPERLTSLTEVKSTHAGFSGSRRLVSTVRFDQLRELTQRLSVTTVLLLCALFTLVHDVHAADNKTSPKQSRVQEICKELWNTLLPETKTNSIKATDKFGHDFTRQITTRFVLKNETGQYILNFGDISSSDRLYKQDFDAACEKQVKHVALFSQGTNIKFSKLFLTLYNLNKFVSELPFWVGLFSVMIFSMTRFKLTLPEREKLAPPLSPRSFTTAFRYWIASFTYMGCYATLYLAVLLVGAIPGVHRQVLDYLAGPFTSDVATPAWAALLATAVIPAVPAISTLDAWLRARLQEFASIPNKARAIADDLLASLKKPKPAEVDENTPTDELIKAIEAHKERLAQLWEIKPKLQELADNQRSRRYSEFFGHNMEIERFLETEVSGGSANKRMNRLSARYIEDKYSSTVPKVARFLICAMLSAEGTEPRVRDRLKDDLKFNIERSKFRFNYGLILEVPFVIFGAVLASSLFSYAVYKYLPHKTPASGDVSWSSVFGLFLGWSFQTVLLYLPSITIAAAAAMYVLDKIAEAPKERLPGPEYFVAVLLTMVATGMLCFFILLGLGIMLPTFFGQTHRVMTLSQLWPWAIPPTLVATTYMCLSTRGISTGKHAQTLWYALLLAGVAAFGSWLAYNIFRWAATEQKLAELMSPLPSDALTYLLYFTPLGLGGALGWVLSGTREPSGQEGGSTPLGAPATGKNDDQANFRLRSDRVPTALC